MIKEAIEYIKTQGRLENRVQEIFNDGEEIHKLVVTDADGHAEIKSYMHPPASRKHEFYTVGGFVEFLNNPASQRDPKNEIAVMVGKSAVISQLNYRGVIQETATLKLEPSPEYRALMRLAHIPIPNQINANPLSQKELWRLLISDLYGAIDDSLLLQISGIQASRSIDDSTEIDVTGVTNSAGGDKITIRYLSGKKDEGERTAEVQVDWEFKGRPWECWDGVISVPLRMEQLLDKDNKCLRFIFHPRALERTLNDARAHLANAIAGATNKDVSVFQGEF